jgi:hypothetical protein
MKDLSDLSKKLGVMGGTGAAVFGGTSRLTKTLTRAMLQTFLSKEDCRSFVVTGPEPVAITAATAGKEEDNAPG